MKRFLFDTYLAASTFCTPLPGPDRKRKVSPYCYRVTHCSGDPQEVGCTLAWEVLGGRQTYQVALERETDGSLRWHCTCADSVYRSRTCKHIRGIQALGRPTPSAN
jgi:hypothetical protein